MAAEVIAGLCSASVFLQDEQLHRNLHEEINHLALKLEKQGKTDGKSISSRRKGINKMYFGNGNRRRGPKRFSDSEQSS